MIYVYTDHNIYSLNWRGKWSNVYNASILCRGETNKYVCSYGKLVQYGEICFVMSEEKIEICILDLDINELVMSYISPYYGEESILIPNVRTISHNTIILNSGIYIRVNEKIEVLKHTEQICNITLKNSDGLEKIMDMYESNILNLTSDNVDDIIYLKFEELIDSNTNKKYEDTLNLRKHNVHEYYDSAIRVLDDFFVYDLNIVYIGYEDLFLIGGTNIYCFFQDCHLSTFFRSDDYEPLNLPNKKKIKSSASIIESTDL